MILLKEKNVLCVYAYWKLLRSFYCYCYCMCRFAFWWVWFFNDWCYYYYYSTIILSLLFAWNLCLLLLPLPLLLPLLPPYLLFHSTYRLSSPTGTTLSSAYEFTSSIIVSLKIFVYFNFFLTANNNFLSSYALLLNI